MIAAPSRQSRTAGYRSNSLSSTFDVRSGHEWNVYSKYLNIDSQTAAFSLRSRCRSIMANHLSGLGAFVPRYAVLSAIRIGKLPLGKMPPPDIPNRMDSVLLTSEASDLVGTFISSSFNHETNKPHIASDI